MSKKDVLTDKNHHFSVWFPRWVDHLFLRHATCLIPTAKKLWLHVYAHRRISAFASSPCQEHLLSVLIHVPESKGERPVCSQMPQTSHSSAYCRMPWPFRIHPKCWIMPCSKAYLRWEECWCVAVGANSDLWFLLISSSWESKMRCTAEKILSVDVITRRNREDVHLSWLFWSYENISNS